MYCNNKDHTEGEWRVGLVTLEMLLSMSYQMEDYRMTF